MKPDFPAFWNPEVLCEGSAYSMLPEDVVHRNADDARKLIHDLKELLDEAEPAVNFKWTILHETHIQEFGRIVNKAIRILDQIQESDKIMNGNK